MGPGHASRTGAAAIDLAWTAAGRLDGYFEAGLQPWDVAAGALLVREAGGVVLDFDGRDDIEDSGTVLALLDHYEEHRLGRPGAEEAAEAVAGFLGKMSRPVDIANRDDIVNVAVDCSPPQILSVSTIEVASRGPLLVTVTV